MEVLPYEEKTLIACIQCFGLQIAVDGDFRLQGLKRRHENFRKAHSEANSMWRGPKETIEPRLNQKTTRMKDPRGDQIDIFSSPIEINWCKSVTVDTFVNLCVGRQEREKAKNKITNG